MAAARRPSRRWLQSAAPDADGCSTPNRTLMAAATAGSQPPMAAGRQHGDVSPATLATSGVSPGAVQPYSESKRPS
jgi:hypothetical protein